MKAWAVGDLNSGINKDKCSVFWQKHRKHVAEKCEKCWAYMVCRGPCPWEVADVNGEFKGTSIQCERRCSHIESGAYLYGNLQRDGLDKENRDKSISLD